MERTFEVSYLSGNVALAPGRELIIASIKHVLVSSLIWEDPKDVYDMLAKDEGLYEDPETKLVWVPLPAIVKIQRMVQ